MGDEYTEATYGDRIADLYDDRYIGSFAEDTTKAVSFLNELAGAGPALELGVGTGRIALPLAENGVEVHGIDASEAMLAKLRAKPGGETIPVTVGTFPISRSKLASARVCGLQHLLRPADAGRAGLLLRGCRRSPGARRDLRDAGVRARRHQIRRPQPASGGRISWC